MRTSLGVRDRVVHQLSNHRAGHVLHDVVVNVGGDDSHCDDLAPGLDNAPDVLIADANHVLSVDFKKVVIDQETIPCSGGVNCQGYNPALFKLESNVPCGILKEICCISNCRY